MSEEPDLSQLSLADWRSHVETWLDSIDTKLDELLCLVRAMAPQTQQMAHHVEFVEGVYTGMRSRLTGIFGQHALPNVPTVDPEGP